MSSPPFLHYLQKRGFESEWETGPENTCHIKLSSKSIRKKSGLLRVQWVGKFPSLVFDMYSNSFIPLQLLDSVTRFQQMSEDEMSEFHRERNPGLILFV